MRVLLVTPSYFPIVGGSEILTCAISTKLRELGIHSDIMTFNMDRKWSPKWRETITENGSTQIFREAAVNPFCNLPNPMFNIFRINLLPKPSFMNKFRNYDIIHFIGEADLSFPAFSYFIRKPKLFQCVGIFRKGGIYKYYTSERPRIGLLFKKFFPRLANKFIISSLAEKDLLYALGVPESKIAILSDAVDIQVFHPDSAKKSENIVLFVGRIDRIKGLHVLLKALTYVKFSVKLVIIGPQWDPEYFKEIVDLSSAINATGFHNVTLLGELNSSDLVPWYQKASVLVCPFVYETCSNVVRESLACGTPVVSTGSHLLENHSDGILLAHWDPEDLANAINKLLGEPAFRERFGKDGREIIERYFSWKKSIDDLVKIYDDILNSNSQDQISSANLHRDKIAR